MRGRGGGFLNAAEQILVEWGEPMRGEEIIRVGLRRGLFAPRARSEDTALGSLLGTLYSEIARTANRRGFVCYGKIMFGLARWVSSTELPAARMPTRRGAHSSPTAPKVPLTSSTLEKLERIRRVMSVEEFRHDWGEIHDRLLAAERTRGLTHAPDQYLIDRIRPLVQRNQDFLQGRGSDSPRSEIICDWIFVCYTLELYREGAALWSFVNKGETDAWQYERTAKLGAACRTRVGSESRLVPSAPARQVRR